MVHNIKTLDELIESAGDTTMSPEGLRAQWRAFVYGNTTIANSCITREIIAADGTYFTTISESRLLNVPGLQPLRKELLDSAMKYYRDFLSQRGHDPIDHADDRRVVGHVGLIRRGTAAGASDLGHDRLGVGLRAHVVDRDDRALAEQVSAAIKRGVRQRLARRVEDAQRENRCRADASRNRAKP